VSSFRGANTLVEGQQINGQTHREERQRRDTQRTDRRETQKRDQSSDQRRRSRKIQAADPKRNQDRSVTQIQRVITHCKKRL
jgi:hypothetical protein